MPWAIEYAYDKDNHVKALRYDGSNNYLVNYTFDKLNRITSRKLRNVNMKQSYYNIIRSAVFDFLVLGILIFIAEMGILPKKLRPINDPRWFFFIVFILWIIWLGFSDAASAIIEYCFKHPVLRKRAVISNAVKKKTYKYCKFKNITLITADGLVGVYEYVGEFNFDIDNHIYDISYLPHSRLICGITELAEIREKHQQKNGLQKINNSRKQALYGQTSTANSLADTPVAENDQYVKTTLGVKIKKLLTKLLNVFRTPIQKKAAWYVIIGGIIIGTVFCFGMPYWQGNVDMYETNAVRGYFDGYEVHYSSHENIENIRVRLANQESYKIDGSCANDSLLENLKKINPGTQIDILLHPRGNYVMQLSTDNMELLSFETSRKLMTGEAKGFVYLGAFMYVMAAICAVKLVREEVY